MLNLKILHLDLVKKSFSCLSPFYNTQKCHMFFADLWINSCSHKQDNYFHIVHLDVKKDLILHNEDISGKSQHHCRIYVWAHVELSILLMWSNKWKTNSRYLYFLVKNVAWLMFSTLLHLLVLCKVSSPGWHHYVSRIPIKDVALPR